MSAGSEAALRKKFEEAEQGHVFAYFDELSEDEKAELEAPYTYRGPAF